nr:YoaK family protein [Glaciecola sp. XM2]
MAFVAGMINALGLLGFEHQAVSHVSGSATALGIELFEFTLTPIIQLLGILLAFALGAAISGFMLYGSSLKLSRRYHSALFLEACLLFIAFVMLNMGSFWGLMFATAACGLQNALATTYSGAVIRTTHLTGIFTDFGIMIGAALRGEAFDKRKAILFSLIILGFVTGGFVGAVLFEYFLFRAMLAPTVICLILSLVYRQYQRKHLIVD